MRFTSRGGSDILVASASSQSYLLFLMTTSEHPSTPELTRTDLTIVYINRGMGHLLLRSLKSLESAQPALTMQIIVVHVPGADPPSLRDEAMAIVPSIEWIEHPRFGIALLRNLGIARATGRYVMMLDADTIVPKGSFERIIEFMDSHPKLAGCGPHTELPNGSVEYSVRRFYTAWTVPVRRSALSRYWPQNPVLRYHLMLDCNHARPLDIDWMAGACYVMRQEAIRHIGDFDESFFFGFEDVDWCYRAKLAGWHIGFVPDATIIHDVQRSSARSWNRMAFEHLRSGLLFWDKHRMIPKPPAAGGERFPVAASGR